ncbi:MAG: hypothetical protein ACYS0F_19715, partial [Planctomycetota bacterium]
MRWTALLLIAIACGQGEPAAEVKGVDGFPGLLDADGADRDGDGLSDEIEETPRTILIDSSGFGFDEETKPLEARVVTSDPRMRDTDGDGLEDHEEWLIRTDPRSVDTDGDGLSDYDEWNQYFTSPVSVDSDGDARGSDGSLPPNGFLFDGIELRDMGTSPTLSDTDGDGVWDSDEIDHPFRSAVIAEVPRIDFERVGELDIRLGIDYEESAGAETSYGSSTTRERSRETSTENSTSTSSTIENQIAVGTEVKFGGDDGFSVVSRFIPVPSEVTLKFDYSHTWSETNETTTTNSESIGESLAKESSRYRAESSTKTELASRGEISLGMRIRNVGNTISFRLTNLGLALAYVAPGDGTESAGRRRVLGTLVPDLPAFTLAPGQATGEIAVRATDVNASLLKEFLANPRALSVETSYFDMENDEGINFAFLTENAYSQTALIVIDKGDGRVSRYRVATNVARNKDGSYAGIQLRTALRDSLQIPFQTQLLPTDVDGKEVLVSTLTKIDDVMTDGSQIGPGLRFEDVVLRAGDVIILEFFRDEDGDGLSSIIEGNVGTDSECTDCDHDGLDDGEETLIGWCAGHEIPRSEWGEFKAKLDAAQRALLTPGLPDSDYQDANDTIASVQAETDYYDPVRGYPRWVWSNPKLEDTDFDGLKDADEYAARTDPANPDTDGDGIDDGEDPAPLSTATRFRVNIDVDQQSSAYDPTAPDHGRSWSNAFQYLGDALVEAGKRNSDFYAEDPADPGSPLRVDGEAVPFDPTDADPDNDTLLLREGEPVLLLENDVGEIWVARGTYLPTQTPGLNTFRLPRNVRMFGGFKGTELVRGQREARPALNGTVLASVPAGGNWAQNNTQSLLLLSLTSTEEEAPQADRTVVDGFTLRRTKLAIRVDLGSPQLSNLRCLEYLGAVYEQSGASRFSQCTFSGGLRNAVRVVNDLTSTVAPGVAGRTT